MNLAQIRQYDPSHMFDLIVHLPKQIETAWQNANNTFLPRLGSHVNKLVFAGMGGSAISGDLAAGLFTDQTFPILVHRDYTLPNYVDSQTLLVVSSYSGNTEETLSALHSAKSKTGHIICISSNGELEKVAVANGYGYIKVPVGQPPRTALGYLFFSLLAVLQKYNLIPDLRADVDEVLQLTRALTQRYSDYANPENPAVGLAQQLQGRIPIIYGAYEPNAALPTRWRNQLSENAKILAFSSLLPEMNHNDIVGWHPVSPFLDRTLVIFLMDDLMSARIRARINITREIISQQGAKTVTLSASGTSKLARTFSLLVLIDFASFYLAVLNQVDPTEIPNIDLLKSELAKM